MVLSKSSIRRVPMLLLLLSGGTGMSVYIAFNLGSL